MIAANGKRATPNKISVWKSYRTAAWVLCVGIGLSVGVFFVVRGRSHHEMQAIFDRQSKDRSAQIENATNGVVLTLKAFYAFYASSHSVERDEFKMFAAPFSVVGGIKAIEWVPRVPGDERVKWESDARKDGLDDFLIRERTREGSLVAAPRRKEFFPIYFTEPHRGNEAAAGLDLSSDPLLRDAFDRSCDSGKIVATQPYLLDPGQKNEIVLTVVQPIYRNGKPADTIPSRRENLLGFVMAVVNPGLLAESGLASLQAAGIDIAVRDDAAPLDENLLYLHTSRTRLDSRKPPTGQQTQDSAGMSWTAKIEFGGRQWSVTCTPSPEFFSRNASWDSWMVLAAGSLLTGLVVWNTFQSIGENSRLRRIADELAVANEEREIAAAEIQDLYNKAPCGYHSLDEDGAYVRINDTELSWLGFSREEVVGKKFIDIVPIESREFFNKDFLLLKERGWVQDLDIEIVRKDGTVMPVLLNATVVKDLSGGFVMTRSTMFDIAKRKQTETALAESEEKIHLLLDSTAEAIYGVDFHGLCTFCNPACLHLLGYDRLDELLGKDMHDQIHYSHPNGEPYPKKECKIFQAYQLGERTHCDTEVLWRKDGTSIPAEYWSHPQRRGGIIVGAVVTFVDITERKQAEEEARRAKELVKHENAKLTAMISCMEEGFAFADADDVIVEVNEFLCRFMGEHRSDYLGKKRSDFLGKRIADLHQGDILENILRLVEGFRGNPNSGPISLQRPFGAAEVIMRVQPIYQNGKYDGVLLNVIDVTELVKARHQAETANRAKSSFLAKMSHEIRTPMTAILGYTDLLADPQVNSSTRDNYLAVVRRNGEHLLHLINDILDLSKIEADKLLMDIQRCSLVSILADVASMMRPRADQCGNSLAIEYAGELPETIDTDAARLRQTIVNLVGNAVKFTENGTVRVRTSFLRDWRGGLPAVKIEVIDTGIGIREEVLSKLFEPFSQGEAGIEQKFGGTGLGLVISRHIVELLGGELTVESLFGRGSTFTITVPTGELQGVKMLQCPAEVIEESAPALQASTCETLAGVRILLAEDGFDNRELIGMILRNAGAKVEIAENGRIAVHKAEAGHFDMIVMDMNMPEMDGYEATRLLRSRDYDRPILALTANAMTEDVQRSLAAGCNDHLTKPINRPLLVQTIQRYAGKGAAGGGAASPPANEAPTVEHGAIRSDFADDPDIAPLLDGFVARLSGYVRELRDSHVSGRYEDLQRTAHQLKGSGGSYGYPLLTEASAILENAAKAKDSHSAAAALERVDWLCKAIVEGFSAGINA